MQKTDNSGPAFPIHPDLPARVGCVNAQSDAGMTLRDWFAGQALAGYFAYQWAEHQNTATLDTAQYIYQMADAMLEARNG